MRTVRAVLNLTRMHTAGFEVLVFLLGPLIVGAPLDETVVAFIILGVLVNSFIFVVNDLADLPRDRANPARQSSPLVSGVLSEPTAIAAACSLPTVMWLIVASADWPPPAQVAFAASLLVGGFLCVYQKTLPRVHPLVLDTLFGATMAAPILVTIAALDEPVTSFSVAVAGAFLVLCLGLNVIGGNLKDLAADVETGFRTTSLALGVRPSRSGDLPSFSGRFRAFAFTVVAGTSAFLLWAVASAGRSTTTQVVVGLGVLAGGAAMTISLCHLFAGRRAPSARGREPFFSIGLLMLLVVTCLVANPLQVAAVTVAAVIWDRAFRLISVTEPGTVAA